MCPCVQIEHFSNCVESILKYLNITGMLKYWNISVMLDYCEIDYTEKQVMKLEKLLNTFLKKYIIKMESEREARRIR